MADHIASELRKAFELATMRQEAKHLKTCEHWGAATAVRDRAQRLRDTEERLFRERYDTRVEAAHRRIVDDAASRQRSFTPAWAGADRFDSAQTLRQADRDVRSDHERRLGRIAAGEFKALNTVVERARREASGPEPTFPFPTGPGPSRLRTGPDQ